MKIPVAIIIGAIIVSLTIHYTLRFNPKDEIIKICVNENYSRYETLEERLETVKEECY